MADSHKEKLLDLETRISILEEQSRQKFRDLGIENNLLEKKIGYIKLSSGYYFKVSGIPNYPKQYNFRWK